MLHIILSIFVGIVFGTITGLIPGIHINLVATMLAAISFSKMSPEMVAVFISSMAITHTFIDFIPSIYLGSPDEDTALATLPGHELLLKGKGHLATLLSITGSVSAIILTAILTPLLILAIPKIYPFIQQMMSFILIITAIFLISKETGPKTWAAIIFILSGFLGIATLNLQIKQPLLPLLTGLFGSSTLIHSISKHTKIPKQKIGKLILNKDKIIKPLISTAIVSPICSFLPGLGSSQAAILGSSTFKKFTREQFIILLGSINTLVMSISFVTLYSIQKSRTGAAETLSQLIELSPEILIYILISIALASLASFFITKKLSIIFSKNIHKINYSKISKFVLLFLSIITFAISGVIGFFVFITSTFLGITAIYAGVRRGHLMGCLLIPTAILYLPFI